MHVPVRNPAPQAATTNWHRALSEADQHDLARRLTNYYQTLDAREYRAPTPYHEKLYADSIGRMNGRAIRIVSV